MFDFLTQGEIVEARKSAEAIADKFRAGAFRAPFVGQYVAWRVTFGELADKGYVCRYWVDRKGDHWVVLLNWPVAQLYRTLEWIGVRKHYRSDWGQWQNRVLSDFAGTFFRERIDLWTGRKFFQYWGSHEEVPGDGTEVPDEKRTARG